MVRVSDVDYSSRFYAALGLEFQHEQHGSGPIHYSTDLGGTILELYPATEKFPVTSVRLGFEVSSVDELLNGLSDFRHDVVSAPRNTPWGYRCVIVDPDGHRIELSQAS